jgi:2,3-bisphosphoglycerate-independent phosphoglycerate mutase
MTNVRRKPVVLIVRDGWGENPNRQWDHANAIVQADTPVADRLMKQYPHTLIKTSGEDVGLPAGVMGNSEVGHQNIGAGRIVDQEVMRITRAIRDGSFMTKPALVGAIQHVQKTGGTLHLLGLMSDGRVHSDIEHAYAIIDLAKKYGLGPDRFAIHVITDGRDTSPQSGIEFVRKLENEITKRGTGRIASVIGRYYALDRDLRWDRVEKSFNLLTQGSPRVAKSAVQAIEDYYSHPTEKSRTGDEFIVATSIDDGHGIAKVSDGDAVVFMNYRGDRPRELTKAFVYDDQAWTAIEGGGFDRGKRIENLYFATMAGYETGLPVQVIFEKPAKMPNILGDYVAAHGLKQFRCAETEKYPHVTFFFNDYRDDPFKGEDRSMAASPRDVSTYDQKPEMSAEDITTRVLQEIHGGNCEVIIVNFANGDMVGHTGVLEAAIKAVEKVDDCTGRIIDAVIAKGGSAIVTADHGNCEQMIDPETLGPHTAHTTFDVPLIVVDSRYVGKPLRSGGRLADIAPTMLELLGLDQPAEMTGQSLLL